MNWDLHIYEMKIDLFFLWINYFEYFIIVAETTAEESSLFCIYELPYIWSLKSHNNKCLFQHILFVGV